MKIIQIICILGNKIIVKKKNWWYVLTHVNRGYSHVKPDSLGSPG